MPTTFTFSADSPINANYLALGLLTPGAGPGVNDPRLASAIASGTISPAGDADVIAVTLLAGQVYNFDIDGGAGDASGGSVDLALTLIDSRGREVATSSTASIDSGSFSAADPRLNLQVNTTGTYYLAVHAENTDYVNGAFTFQGAGGTGDYNLVVSTALPARQNFSNANQSLSFSDARQNVFSAGGNDFLSMNGGNDLANGGTGNDTLLGGTGDDELVGADGVDELFGGSGADVLVGGGSDDTLVGAEGADALYGGDGRDDVFGGSGNDSIWAEASNDLVSAGTGADFVRGGLGADVLFGGGDGDTFHWVRGESDYSANGALGDRVQDFSTIDVLDLSDLLIGTLTFRGGLGYSGANQVRVVDLRDGNGNGFQEVRVNLDADLNSELAFRVDTVGNFRLSASDFIL